MRLSIVLVLSVALASCAPEVVHLDHAPPALSGGSLALLSNDHTAVVADPDRDRILVVDLTLHAVSRTITLPAGSEPGRVAESTSGRVHVVLRGTGSLFSFDAADPSDAGTTQHVCDMPRGVTYDPASDHVLVACRSGELVTLTTEGAIVQSVHVQDDLRDVIAAEGRVFVTRFRSAELLEVDPSGHILSRRTPTGIAIQGNQLEAYSAAVAWRAVYVPDQRAIAVVHQRGRSTTIFVHERPPSVPASTAYYGASSAPNVTCPSGVVHGAVTFFGIDGSTTSGGALPNAVLPIDLAVRNGQVAVVAAGAGDQNVLVASPSDLAIGRDGCAHADGRASAATPTAVALDASGQAIWLERDPSVLVVGTTRIALGGAAVRDTGHDLFHGGTSEHVACASCHPEGGEDGRLWVFDDVPRRTQAIGGGISSTAPFHWDGAEPDFAAIVDDVFVARMGADRPSAEQTHAFEQWVNAIPAPLSTGGDPDAIARGRALFEGVGECASCHSGEHLTDDQTLDVGTGGAFQVPSLVGVSHRLPVMHDGCATTLARRFDPSCGGASHGRADLLSASERADVIAYLDSL